MTPKTAQRTAQHARRLLTAGILTPHQYAVLDALLWRLRRQGRPDLTAAYTAIARLANVSKDTAIGAIAKLESLGIIQKAKRRILVQWGRGRVASRQIANAYVFIYTPPTESAPPAADRGRENIPRLIPRSVDNSPLEAALGRLGSLIMAS
jgi:hypothetical protein